MTTEAMRSALDERPLPWVIALGVDRESEVGKALQGMGGEVVFCRKLSEVRQSDFHFLVCEETPGTVVHQKLNVLQLCNSVEPLWMTPYANCGNELFRVSGDRASLFDVTDNAKTLGLEPLIKSTILGDLRLGSDYKVFQRPQGFQPATRQGQGTRFMPLLRERDGGALAGYLINPTGSEW